MSQKCPLCKLAIARASQLCPKCGSLEGISDDDAMLKAPARGGKTFGFDWGCGLVAPHVRAPVPAIQRALLAANVDSTSSVIDLGCGDGTVCFEAAKLGATVVGVDLDEKLIDDAKRKLASNKCFRSGALTFRVQDLKLTKLGEFSHICMFLLPSTLGDKWLGNSMLLEIERGATIISFLWPIPELERNGKVVKMRHKTDCSSESGGMSMPYHVYKGVLNFSHISKSSGALLIDSLGTISPETFQKIGSEAASSAFLNKCDSDEGISALIKHDDASHRLLGTLICCTKLEKLLRRIAGDTKMLFASILDSPQVSAIFGTPFVSLLKHILLPKGLNLRNILWHGHMSAERLDPRTSCALLSIFRGAEHEFNARDSTPIPIDCLTMDALEEVFQSVILPRIDAEKLVGISDCILSTPSIMESVFCAQKCFVPADRINTLKTAVEMLRQGAESYFLTLLVVCLEHSLRLWYAKVNKMPSAAIPQDGEYFVTLDGWG